MDALCAVLRAVQDGEGSEQQAITRWSRSPYGGWIAMAPVCKRILAIEVGERTLAMAQRVVHHVTQGLAPEVAPPLLTDSLRASRTALVTSYGAWMPPARRQAPGPTPQPRWMPRPGLFSAQVVKSSRRWRIGEGTPRVSFGTAETIESILAKRGEKMKTSFLERLNLEFRQPVAAIGRRGKTLGKPEAGLRHHLALVQAYHNFCWPHAS